MEPKGPLPHSQVPHTCPYPEPVQSNPYPHIPLPEIHLNIILPSKPGFSKWSLSLWFLHKNCVSSTCSHNIVSVIKSRIMRWAGHVARTGERRVVYRVLVGKPEWKRPFGGLRRRWEDNIKMDLQEVGCGGVEWIALAENRDRWWALVNDVMKLRVP